MSRFLMDRSIFENDIWLDPIRFRLFFLIVGKAAFRETKIGNQTIKRGQYLRSYRMLRDDLEYLDNNALKKYSLETIKRSIDKLTQEGRLLVTTTELGTLFEVVNYQSYQEILGKKTEASNTQTNSRQTPAKHLPNNKNTVINTVMNNNTPENKFSGEHLEFSTDLRDIIKQKYPYYPEPNLNKWAETIRKIEKIDGYSMAQIEEVTAFAIKHEFWSQQIRSPDNLRKHFVKLIDQSGLYSKWSKQNGT